VILTPYYVITILKNRWMCEVKEKCKQVVFLAFYTVMNKLIYVRKKKRKNE